ncbi:Filamentous hemagglutinin FhaB/tRNA nuclease CdiA-like TPS domain-containing protein [Nostoc sp. DSM 114160]|jgi:filamentous hemagglutinin family protein
MSFKTAPNWLQGLGVAIVSAVTLYANISVAQITPDSTLPNNSNVKLEGNTRMIEGGTTRGANLFHSFEEFSVPNDSTAWFNNSPDIQNILTRVTGKSISNIDGLIRANGKANLFLLNPNGIIFGKNASLNIGGSFIATTANAIGFSNLGFFSASNPEAPSPLLTVNPNALLFNQIAAAPIQNSSTAPAGSTPGNENAFGLRVPDGRSLLLVGGNVNMDGGRLNAFGGLVELGGLASAGTVGLNGDDNSRLSFPNSVERSDVFLSDGAQVNVFAGNGGSIAVNARNLEMTGESQLFAGIDSRLGSNNSQAGNISVNATVAINLNNGSVIGNEVRSQANGQGGDVNISASTLQVDAGAQISTITSGAGKGGNLSVDAQDVQLIGRSADDQSASSLFAGAQPNSIGDAGNLKIKTNTLIVRDGAQISTITSGAGKAGNLSIDAQDMQLIGTSADGKAGGLFAGAQPNSTGDAGNLTIKTNTLLVRDGVEVSTITSGAGKGGNLSIDAQDVQLIGTSADGEYPSGLFAGAQPNSTGDAGNLTIKTNTLLVRDGAQVSTITLGAGKGGNLSVNAQDVQLIATTADGKYPSGLSAGAQPNLTGDAGDVTIKTNTLLVRDGAQVNTATFGAGKGGNLRVDAQDVQLIGRSSNNLLPSSLGTSAQRNSLEDAGNLTIKTNTLLVRDGAQVITSTSSAGKGGNLKVDAQDVQLIGTSANDRFRSGLFAQANSTGNAGDLTVTTHTLLVRDGAWINTATFGAGKGGNLSVNAQDVQLIGTSADNRFRSGLFARANSTGDAGDLTVKTNTLLVRDEAQVNTGTSGAGNGGNLRVDAQDVQLIGRSADKRNGGLFTRASQNSIGDAGNLTVTTHTLLVQDARVSVRSSITGTAGKMTLYARSIRLNHGLLIADTGSPKVDRNREEATININSKDLIMTGNSNIRTNARRIKVIGGNINIDADVLVGFENSDISANSAKFRGGNVTINTKGIFGIAPLSRQELERLRPKDLDPRQLQTSDITATGQTRSLSGNVEIITPDINPTRGLVELPINLVDASRQISTACTPGTRQFQNTFVATGRGGLPMSPTEPLQDSSTVSGWVKLRPKSENLANTKPVPKSTAVSTTSIAATIPIVEASGWVIDRKGNIELVALPQLNPHSPWQTPASCPVSQGGVKYGKISAAKASN